MSQPTILLTGATGNTGQVVAEQLRARGVAFTAMARSEPNRRTLEAAGTPTIAGDFDDPRTLERALAGIEKAYLVCTPDEHLVRRETAFIRAAKAAGVRLIVKCSAFSAAPLAVSQNLRSHATIERELSDSGLDYTIVRPHGFMQTFTMFNWRMIQEAGVLSMPAGDGGIPLIDVRDVAAVVTLALTEPGHAGKAYDITGPAVLNMYEQAEILARVLGRPITYVPGSERQLEMLMKLFGVPPVPAEHVLEIFRMQREHAMEQTTSTLRELGIEPIDYESFVRDLVTGRTGGGNSFQPPQTLLVRTLDRVMPPLMRAYVRFSRPAVGRRTTSRTDRSRSA
jgi:uncharacterized protein YbjT (DUF2867 family)